MPRALKEKLTGSIEKCKQFSGFLKTVRQTIAVEVVISPLEHAQKKRNDDDEICVIDAMKEMERSETPREIGVHIRQKQKKKKRKSKKHESVVVGPTKHTANPALHRHTHTAKCERRPSPPAGAMGLFGTSLGIRDVLLALGTCFDTWDFIPILNVNIIF